MKPRSHLLLLVPLVIVLLGLRKPYSSGEWQTLFNGKDLSGWDRYLGPPLDDNGKKLSDTPLGLNNDPNRVFTVVDNDGDKVIRISGENWGAISTKDEYENFQLQLM